MKAFVCRRWREYEISQWLSRGLWWSMFIGLRCFLRPWKGVVARCVEERKGCSEQVMVVFSFVSFLLKKWEGDGLCGCRESILSYFLQMKKMNFLPFCLFPWCPFFPIFSLQSLFSYWSNLKITFQSRLWNVHMSIN